MKYLILFFYLTFSYSNVLNEKLKVVNVCINPDWSPIEFREDGVPKGISIDILKNIAKKRDLKLNFIFTNTWKQSQEYLRIGKCDITPTALKTLKREKYAIFTKAYLTYDLAIITTQNKPYVTNLKAILDKTITRKKGSGVITKLKKLSSNIKILEAEDYKTMFELVDNKKVYATIATLPVFAYYKKKYNIRNLKIAGFTGWKYPLRIMVNKNRVELKKILDLELNSISPELTQKIYEKWIVKTEVEFNYKQFFIILGISIFIVLILITNIYQLREKNRKLSQLSKVKSKFLSNMSHEIRTPLNAIMGFIQILKKNPKEVKTYIPLIDGSSQVLLTIIDNILNFSRLEDEKKLTIRNSEFNFKDLENMIVFCKEEAEKKGLKFEIDLKLDDCLFGDVDKIRNVLVYLLDNSVKFTKQGVIKLTMKYQKGKLFISIKDTGIGISKENMDKVFEPFVQIDDRINKEYQGIGIGLPIAKKLIKSLGGTLRVKSEEGKGSEFYFEIPIKKIEKKDKKIEYKKVLVVEDNKANQMFLKVVLKQLKLDCELAENGQIAVEKYEKYHYPLILMDINMPIMDGITATKKIREYEKKYSLKESKIIAVTANTIDGDEEKFLNSGMNGYISKPVDIKKLEAFLK